MAPDEAETHSIAQVRQAEELLREGLAGADIDFMLTEDPALLFEDLASLETGACKVVDAQGGCTWLVRMRRPSRQVRWTGGRDEQGRQLHPGAVHSSSDCVVGLLQCSLKF